jgi:hypothetical protein
MAARRAAKRSAEIPDYVLEELRARLETHIANQWPACEAVSVRKRGQFAYISAQGPKDAKPEPLCRLRYLGSMDSWEFAYYSWSRESYEPSFLDSGSPVGAPEECFDASANPVLSR